MSFQTPFRRTCSVLMIATAISYCLRFRINCFLQPLRVERSAARAIQKEVVAHYKDGSEPDTPVVVRFISPSRKRRLLSVFSQSFLARLMISSLSYNFYVKPLSVSTLTHVGKLADGTSRSLVEIGREVAL